MTNSPLSSSEQAMVILFGILLLPSWLLMGAGVIPSLVLVFGIVMMMRSGDFSHVRTAGLVFKALGGLALVVAMIFTVISYRPGYRLEDDGIAAAIVAGFYLITVHFLFLRPLTKHSDWVAANGIFATKPKAATSAGAKPSTGMAKAEATKAPSIADELQKWVSLKEAGHITEEEFAEVRRKLLA